jgi:hypothetical protein
MTHDPTSCNPGASQVSGGGSRTPRSATLPIHSDLLSSCRCHFFIIVPLYLPCGTSITLHRENMSFISLFAPLAQFLSPVSLSTFLSRPCRHSESVSRPSSSSQRISPCFFSTNGRRVQHHKTDIVLKNWQAPFRLSPLPWCLTPFMISRDWASCGNIPSSDLTRPSGLCMPLVPCYRIASATRS